MTAKAGLMLLEPPFGEDCLLKKEACSGFCQRTSSFPAERRKLIP
jgi:hypothetical protein